MSCDAIIQDAEIFNQCHDLSAQKNNIGDIDVLSWNLKLHLIILFKLHITIIGDIIAKWQILEFVSVVMVAKFMNECPDQAICLA